MNLHPCFRRTARLIVAMALSALTLFGPALVHAEEKTLSATLSQTPQLSTLTRALQASGLADTLSASPALTLLAPTDAAFAALPAGTLDTLLKPENKEQLVTLLKRHAVAASLDADALKRKREIVTLGGATERVGLVNGVLRIGDARASGRALRSANGYIVVIDRVLLQ